MAKKYFWLKIQEEFFRQKEIKALRKMEKGPLYILIYQKMLVYSLQNNSKIYFDNVEDSFEEDSYEETENYPEYEEGYQEDGNGQE